MDTEQPPNLRTTGKHGGESAPARTSLASGVNAVAELVADLLAATNLLSEDKLNVARGLSFAQPHILTTPRSC